MSVIPCRQNEELQKLIRHYVEVLKIEMHKLGGHGLSGEEFYKSLLEIEFGEWPLINV